MKEKLSFATDKMVFKKSILLLLAILLLTIFSCKSEKNDNIPTSPVTTPFHVVTPSPVLTSSPGRTPFPAATTCPVVKSSSGTIHLQDYTINQKGNKIVMVKYVRKKSRNYTVKIDLTGQILSLCTPEIIMIDKGETISLYPDLKELLRDNKFLSASILSARAKQFDDGLYAAVNIAVQEGTDNVKSKKTFLSNIYNALKGLDDSEDKDLSRAFILAAMELGGDKVNDDRKISYMAENLKEDFLKDQLASKPLGFYTWNQELTQIFQQDRLLKSRISGMSNTSFFPLTNALPLAEAIIKSGEQETYIKYLKLNEQLTNPFPQYVHDFRPLFTKMAQDPNDVFILFPPSRTLETDYIENLDYFPPASFNMSDKLIEEIQSGKLSMKPEKNSGWYDYQLYSLEPLLLPDKSLEAKKLEFTKEYKKRLLNLYKGLHAAMREIHYEQAGTYKVYGGIGDMLDIEPELSLEPLVTYYSRRADAYKFIHRVLLNTFGTEGLKNMHRYIFAGPVEKNLDEELTEMERLFNGSAHLSALEIGLKLDSNSPDDIEFTRKWINNMDKDPELSVDSRMMVPVFYDWNIDKTKVWLFLGYEKISLYVSFKSNPDVTVFDERGKKLDDSKVGIIHSACNKDLITPVFEEVYVNKLLDREEFRSLCDKYKSRNEILKALENL